MASLRDQLTEILPGILPNSPDEAVNGTRLIQLVEPHLRKRYKENTLRTHFSVMSADIGSVIARVEGGQGYYLRDGLSESEQDLQEELEASASKLPQAESKGLDEQAEEKFRALFMRYAKRQTSLPMRINHSAASKAPAGFNKWKFPDVVLLDWEVGMTLDDAGNQILDKDLLKVKASLGEQPLRLTSVELKVSVDSQNFRESFFQCVSNSKWAHSSALVIAKAVTDNTLAEELRRLGTSYDVTVLSYSIDLEKLQKLPSASAIADSRKVSEKDFDALIGMVDVKTLATGKRRPSLDWEHVKDMRKWTTDFVGLFEWISFCLGKSRSYSYEDFLDYQQRFR